MIGSKKPGQVNSATLTAMVDEARRASLRLARHMLDHVSAETLEVLHELQQRGWRVALEVATDARLQSSVALTCVGPGGERRVLADVAEDVAPHGAH